MVFSQEIRPPRAESNGSDRIRTGETFLLDLLGAQLRQDYELSSLTPSLTD